MDLDERRRLHFDGIPPWYSGRTHFWVQTGLSFGVILPALWLARHATPLEWTLAPLTWVFSNWLEWAVHKGPLHHRWRGLESWYVAHTVNHHAVFSEELMAYENDRELAYVLFPAWFVPVACVVFLPVGLALHRVSPALAAIFYASGIGYFLLYEWLHMLHHSPPEGPVAGSRLAAWLRRHHARHHDPARMEKGNFNISVPLWDYLLGTVLR